MLVRLRWFLIGALSSLSAVGWLAVKVKRAKERLTPANLARQGLDAAADRIDLLAARIDPERASGR